MQPTPDGLSYVQSDAYAEEIDRMLRDAERDGLSFGEASLMALTYTALSLCCTDGITMTNDAEVQKYVDANAPMLAQIVMDTMIRNVRREGKTMSKIAIDPMPMVAEAFRIGVKQLGEEEFLARVEDTVSAINSLLEERHADDPQGMVTALVALDEVLLRNVADLRDRISAWAGLDKGTN